MNRETTRQLPLVYKPAELARSYRPFILATFLVIVSTYLLTLWTHHLMDEFMGSFFMIFALPKLFNIEGFAKSFSRYDLIAKKYLNYARSYPFIELFIGFAYLINYPMRSTTDNKVINLTVVFLTTVGILGVAISLRQNKKLSCACLGSKFEFPLSKITIFENSLMLAMALSMLFFHGASRI
jgi:prepilin signal peptidase PulO-like enzyme (type II secretory pathway)